MGSDEVSVPTTVDEVCPLAEDEGTDELDTENVVLT